jgi:hypothetical protein
MTRLTKWLAGTNALLGAWLVVAPAVFETTSAGLLNDMLVGLLVVSIGTYNYYRTTQGHEVGRWASVANALLGVWLVAAPFVFGGITGAALYNDVTVGALVAVFAGYNAYRSDEAHTERDRRRPAA